MLFLIIVFLCMFISLDLLVRVLIGLQVSAPYASFSSLFKGPCGPFVLFGGSYRCKLREPTPASGRLLGGGGLFPKLTEGCLCEFGDFDRQYNDDRVIVRQLSPRVVHTPEA